MSGWGETILNGGLIVLILGGSYYLMTLYGRAMYNRCRECGTLNARRRTHCRVCSKEIIKHKG
jgi:hypothetical protein